MTKGTAYTMEQLGEQAADGTGYGTGQVKVEQGGANFYVEFMDEVYDATGQADGWMEDDGFLHYTRDGKRIAWDVNASDNLTARNERKLIDAIKGRVRDLENTCAVCGWVNTCKCIQIQASNREVEARRLYEAAKHHVQNEVDNFTLTPTTSTAKDLAKAAQMFINADKALTEAMRQNTPVAIQRAKARK